jgi:maspardin
MRTPPSLSGLYEVRSRYPARIVRTGNLEWRIRDTGGGETVQIFLPGALGNADIFYLQLLHLAPRVRCIAIDYPGAQTVALADGLDALLDTLEIDRANLLGSSLAGYWLQTFGSRHHGRIKSLILASTFRESQDLRNHPQFSIPKLQAVGGEVLKAETLSQLQAREPDRLRDLQIELLRDGQNGASLRERMLAAATAPPAPLVPPGKFSIGIIDCEDDPILSVRTRADLSSAYPRARHLTLDSGGHYPHVIRAEEFNRFVEDMLENEFAG